jgi:hypothetical protein
VIPVPCDQMKTLLRVCLQLWLFTTSGRWVRIRYIGIGLGRVGVIRSFFYDSVACETDAQSHNAVTADDNFVHTVFDSWDVVFPADRNSHIAIEGIDFFELTCCDCIHIDWNDFHTDLCYQVFVGTWFSCYSHLALSRGKSTIFAVFTCSAVASFFFRSVQGVVSRLKVCLHYS